MKLNKEQLAKYVKETRFDAFEINLDGSRGTHYGNVNPLTLLSFIMSKNMNGGTVVVTNPGLKLHGQVYPNLGVIEASSFSMRDKDFVNKIKVFAVSIPSFDLNFRYAKS
jgi:hypothetical protein